MSLQEDLLELADDLARRETRRPKQVSLRRSISTAYYALFHLLTSEATALIGANLDRTAAYKVQRWFDHAEMKRVCGAFSSKAVGKQIHSLLAEPTSADLQTVARAFVRLQEARHSADYDLSVSLTRLTALEHVQLSRDAFRSWARIRQSHEASVFAIALLSIKLFEKERQT